MKVNKEKVITFSRSASLPPLSPYCIHQVCVDNIFSFSDLDVMSDCRVLYLIYSLITLSIKRRAVLSLRNDVQDNFSIHRLPKQTALRTCFNSVLPVLLVLCWLVQIRPKTVLATRLAIPSMRSESQFATTWGETIAYRFILACETALAASSFERN